MKLLKRLWAIIIVSIFIVNSVLSVVPRAQAEDAFGALGLGLDANESEINRAFRQLSRTWHPDKYSPDLGVSKEQAEEKFKDLGNARTVALQAQAEGISGEPAVAPDQPGAPGDQEAADEVLQLEGPQQQDATKNILNKIEDYIFKCRNIKFAVKNKTFNVYDIPGFDKIPLPDSVKRVLQNIHLESPAVELKKDCSGSIDGTAVFFGNKVRVKVRMAKKDDRIKYAVIVQLPVGWKFSNISTIFKPVDNVQILNAALIVSEYDFTETDWDNKKIKTGASFVGTIGLGPDLQKFTNMFGEKLDQATIEGVITPKIVGSSFSVELPGQINIGLPGKKPIAQTTGLKLAIYARQAVPGLSVPSGQIGIQTGLRVFLPWQENPIELKGEITVGPTDATLSAFMDGTLTIPKIPINIGKISWTPNIPLEVGDFKAQVGIDYATAAASQGLLSVSAIGFGGKAVLFGKEVRANVYGLAGVNPQLLVDAEFVGGLSLREVLKAGSQVIKVGGKVLGKNVNLFKKYEAMIPNLALDKVKLYIATQEIHFAGQDFPEGMEFKISGNILGTDLIMELKVTEKGLDGLGYMSATKIGPLTITGSGPDGIENTDDDGAMVKLLFNPTKIDSIISFIADADVILGVFGGIRGKTVIKFKATGQSEFEFLFKLYDDLQAEIKAKMDLKKPIETGEVSIDLTTQGLGEFTKAVNKEMQQLVTMGTEKLSAAQKKIKEKELKVTESNLKKLEKKLNSLNQIKNKLDKQVARCKGKVKPDVFAVIDEQFAGKDLTTNDIQHAVTELQKEGLSKTELKEAERRLKTHKRWKSLLVDIKKKAQKAAKKITKKGTPKEVKKLVRKVLTDVSACGKAAELGAKWAAKSVKYQTLKAGIQAANTSIRAARKVLKTGIDVTKITLRTAGKVTEVSEKAIGAFLEKGIHPKRIYAKAKLKDLRKTSFKFEGTVAGKEIKVELPELTNKKEIAKKLLGAIGGLF